MFVQLCELGAEPLWCCTILVLGVYGVVRCLHSQHGLVIRHIQGIWLKWNVCGVYDSGFAMLLVDDVRIVAASIVLAGLEVAEAP